MKIAPLNPWLVIRWAIVAFLFVGTVAISYDQIKTRDVKIATLEKTVKASQTEARKSKSAAERVTKEYADTMVNVGNVVAASERMEEARKKQVAALEEMNSLLRSGAVDGSTVSPSPRNAAVAQTYQGPVVPTAPARSQPVIPSQQQPALWLPPQRHMQAKQIKDRAVAKWKDDHKMVLYEVEKQTEALGTLLEYNKYAANKAILAQAAEKWDPDFSMMVYEVKGQIEALQKLNGR